MIPTNDIAERSLLSLMMANELSAARALAEIEEQDFFDSRHRALFRAMQRLAKESKPITMATMVEVYADFSFLTDVGTEFSLPSLLDSYIESLRNARQRRDIITACTKIITDAQDNEEGYLEAAQKAVGEVVALGGAQVSPVGIEAMEAVTAVSELEMGVQTGFPTLDVLMSGFHRGDLIVVGGRPSMGKTAFAMNIAVNVARYGSTVVVFSLEMSRKSLLQRAAFSLSGCSKPDVIKKDLAKVEKLVQAGAELSQMDLYVDDRGALTADQIHATCHRVKQRKNKLDLVVVDYLQLMRVRQRKNGTREQEVSEISRAMKQMARELDCPVVLLAQLNRGLEARADKEPKMSDLRESGAIEQDADVIIFLYRPAVYELSKDEREAYALVVKHRNGATANVRLNWDGPYYRFTSHYGG